MNAIPLHYEPEIEYPESDGKPMAESDVHLGVIMHLVQALRDHFLADPQVYVAGNLLLYLEKGTRSSVAPDVFVVQGVANRKRKKYLLWEEGQAPCFVLEVTSQSTKSEDLAEKRARYAALGVEEYFLFDPLGEYLRPRFQGLRLRDGEYQPIPISVDGSLTSRKLGVVFFPEGDSLRMRDAATGKPLLGYEDWKALARAAEERAAEERAARRAAEKRAAQERTARRAAEERAAHERAARNAAEERAAEAEARVQALAEEIEGLRRTAKS
jgi:Uma2 family endonuclease